VDEAGLAPADTYEGPLREPDETTTEDDLTLINGIGPRMAERLVHQGITTFAQLAAWGDEDIAHFEEHLPGVQRGRAAREGWVDQARAFVNGAA
jgi:predicted flap endonuclease-1-like 5' DNA nuclease